VRTSNRQMWMVGVIAACIGTLPPLAAQPTKTAPGASQQVATVEQPDANRTKQELSNVLEHYPPIVRDVLSLDPTLLGNPSYLAPYPGLLAFVNAHPEIARNPTFFVDQHHRQDRDPASQALEMWRDVLAGFAAFAAFGMAISLIAWLIRTLIDYRRWSRLSKVQSEVHTKLLDRFTANDDLLAYIQSPAGSKFLESSPIKLDAGPRTVGAPLGRILWSLQGGLVLIAGGIGLQTVSQRVRDEAGQPLHALGVLAAALGIGFLISAIISYVISRRLGLIDPQPLAARAEPPAA
jgi:hypothetical protein